MMISKLIIRFIYKPVRNSFDRILDAVLSDRIGVQVYLGFGSTTTTLKKWKIETGRVRFLSGWDLYTASGRAVVWTPNANRGTAKGGIEVRGGKKPWSAWERSSSTPTFSTNPSVEAGKRSVSVPHPRFFFLFYRFYVVRNLRFLSICSWNGRSQFPISTR